MNKKIVLASKSKVRKNILEKNGLNCIVKPANIDEETVKKSLIKQLIRLKMVTGKILFIIPTTQ